MGDKVINKQGLIFLTLTSLILVLSVYYVTMPNELLLTNNSSYTKTSQKAGKDEKEKKREEVVVKTSNTIEAMKNLLQDERYKLLKELNNKLTNKELSIDEKNNVYEEIKVVNKLQTMEEDIENIIKKEFNLDSFVKVKDDVIEVIVNNSKHDANLAVKIMTCIEKNYKDMYISVSFKE